MQGQYTSISNFENFKKNELVNALSVLDTNLQNKNLQNQVAARMLGYSSYEALQPSLEREDRIRNHFFIERCPIQDNAITIKAGNIIVVVAKDSKGCHGRSLANSEDFMLINNDSSQACMYQGAGTNYDLIEHGDNIDSTGSKNRGCYNVGGGFFLSIVRTGEGLIVDVFDTDKDGSPESYDSIALTFGDAEGGDGEYDRVDLFTPLSERTMPCTDRGVYYKWVKPANDDNGFATFLDIDGKNFEIHLSELMFKSEEEALEAVISGTFGWWPDDVDGAQIIKVTTQLSKNIPHNFSDGYCEDE